MSKKRIITIIKDRKQTKKLKIFAYCIETFSLKQVTINPAENVRYRSRDNSSRQLIWTFNAVTRHSHIQTQISKNN